MKLATEVNAASPAKVEELDTDLMKEFAYNARGDICPIQAFIGGISAQEVMKVGHACTHAHTDTHTDTHTHTHTHAHICSIFVCLSFSCTLSQSLSM